MNKFLVVANWKANLPVKYDFAIPDKIEIAIAPAFPYLSNIPDGFVRAAQDVSANSLGAYTGEVPAEILAKLNVKYCLVGHSERRKYQGETNQIVEQKLTAATKAGLIPILCAQNLAEIPENIRNFSAGSFLIMYEPFSAISTNGQYHPESPERIMATIADWKSKLNLTCRFLYGGSVNPDTAIPPVDGLVVGHASLNSQTFFALIKKCLLQL